MRSSGLGLLLCIVICSPNTFAGHVNWERRWEKLLHIPAQEQMDDFFFVGPGRKTEAKQELAASWQAIAEQKKVGRHQELFACAFPARYQLLRELNLQLPSAKCPELEDWLSLFAATKVYLVYSSSYPNNPASILGHTFLRFDREVGRLGKQAISDLRGYSVAFMATVNPADGPVVYMWKGLTGGYQGHLEIKPFYMSVGVYNNAEGRDLWEYPLPFTPEKINFLLLHLWELSRQTGVNYFFFNQNCSWMILKILEAVDEQLELASKNDWLVIPQETLTEVVRHYHISEAYYRQSLVGKTATKFQQLSWQQQKAFAKGRKNVEALKAISDYQVLEVLVMDWKHRNYQQKTQLKKEEKELYLLAHQRLAQAPMVVTKNFSDSTPEVPTTGGHKLGRIRWQGNEQEQQLGIRYGIHDWDDPPWIFSTNSMINFFQVDLSRKEQDTIKFKRIQLLDLKSLENFSWFFPRWSWSVSATFQALGQSAGCLLPQISAKGGIAKSWSHWRIFWLTGPQLHPEEVTLQTQLGIAGWFSPRWFWHTLSQVSYPQWKVNSEIFFQGHWPQWDLALGVGMLITAGLAPRWQLLGSWYF